MSRSSRLRFSSHQRPLWLLVVLAITLLVTVSIAAAQAASPARLIDSLRRDLGALHAQLERIDPRLTDSHRQTAAFNTALGDGSPAFVRLSMVTVGHAAARQFDQLIGAWRAAGDEPRARGAEALRPRMYGLIERIDRLSNPSNPAATFALRDETEAHLSEFDQALERLIAGPPAMLTAPPDGGPRSASPPLP